MLSIWSMLRCHSYWRYYRNTLTCDSRYLDHISRVEIHKDWACYGLVPSTSTYQIQQHKLHLAVSYIKELEEKVKKYEDEPNRFVKMYNLMQCLSSLVLALDKDTLRTVRRLPKQGYLYE